MTIDPWTFAAIVLMAIATYATRIGGVLLAEHLPRSGRMRVALDALPPAVLTAVIAPALVAGPAEMIAGIISIIAATRLPMVAVAMIAVVSVALLRLVLGS